ncbi:MAG: flagellar motor switch protein FliM [Pirellulaceae bacterium]|nr:flagellar motor switch protein FliM [Pirellulaceae bacterium]
MEEEKLSRADVDSLLNGGKDDPAKPAPAPEAPAKPEVSAKTPPKVRVMAYDFKRPERVGKELVRALQSLHEGLARNFGASLSALLRSMVEVRLISVDQLTYREFIQSVEIPTCFNLVRPKPLDRNWILDVSPALLYPIIDRMLGGAVSSESNLTRPLSEIELRLAGRITNLFLRELKASWASVIVLEIDVERVESNPQLVQIVPPNEVVIMVSFEITMGTTRGMTNLCIPFNTIERVTSKLTNSSWSGYSTVPPNEETKKEMANRLDSSTTHLVVTLAKSQIRTGDLFDLQVGDIISTEKDVQHPLEVEVSNGVKFLASPGSYKGRKAIKIESIVGE